MVSSLLRMLAAALHVTAVGRQSDQWRCFWQYHNAHGGVQLLQCISCSSVLYTAQLPGMLSVKAAAWTVT
jgi:hypothetical protein